MKYLLSIAKPKSYSALIKEIRQHIDAEQAANMKVNQIGINARMGVSKRKLNAQSSNSSKHNGKKPEQYDDQEYVPMY